MSEIRQDVFRELAAAGVAVQVLSVQGAAALLVLRCEECLSPAHARNLGETLRRALRGTALEGVKIAMLDRGLSLAVQAQLLSADVCTDRD